jgi:zinc protease
MFARLLTRAIPLLLIATTATASTGVHEFRLDNGLKILVKEDHRAPVMVSQLWYKIGSSYEHNGITGISHVLEHMMFKGTKAHPAGEFSRIISENGGRENAFTMQDGTGYYQRLASDRLEVSFELESDRMRNLLLEQEEFAKEVKVVMEERRLRTEDKPPNRLGELFFSTAYQTSPYRNPLIGWMNDLESMRVADLQDWYRKWYAPNNATLVVVGDVDPQEVLRLARKYYGPIPSSGVATIKPREEPPQAGTRRVELAIPAEVPMIYMGYKVPALVNIKDAREAYTLEVITGILDGGDSARFARDLVRGRQIAASAGAGYGLDDRLDNLFTVSGVPANGHTVVELEQAFREQITNLQVHPVSQEELARIKTQVVASNVYEQDSIFYQAMRLGRLETIGLGWQRVDEYVAGVKAVTAADVQAAARKYFVDDTLTVAVLKPLPMQAAVGKAPAGGK